MDYGTVRHTLFVISMIILDLTVFSRGQRSEISKLILIFSPVSFSHQWSEYQIKCSKIIARNVVFGFNCKTLLYHPYKLIQKQTNRWFDLSTICALF